jgi:hypothetical protein
MSLTPYAGLVALHADAAAPAPAPPPSSLRRDSHRRQSILQLLAGTPFTLARLAQAPLARSPGCLSPVCAGASTRFAQAPLLHLLTPLPHRSCRWRRESRRDDCPHLTALCSTTVLKLLCSASTFSYLFDQLSLLSA